MVCSLVKELVRELAFKMTALSASILEHKSSPEDLIPRERQGSLKTDSTPTHTYTHCLRFPRKLQKLLASCLAGSQDKCYVQ